MKTFGANTNLMKAFQRLSQQNSTISQENLKKYIQREIISLNSTLKFHDCGIDNYLNYLDQAKQLYEWGVHKPDCKIITDAHDCGSRHDNLIFVSNDCEMLEKIVNRNTTFLNIIEFKSFT